MKANLRLQSGQWTPTKRLIEEGDHHLSEKCHSPEAKCIFPVLLRLSSLLCFTAFFFGISLFRSAEVSHVEPSLKAILRNCKPSNRCAVHCCCFIHRYVDSDEPIDLLNVAFEQQQPKSVKKKTTNTKG